MAICNLFSKVLIVGSVFISGCAQEARHDTQNKTVEIETETFLEMKTYLIAPNCDQLPTDTSCLQTFIPNFCKVGYEETDFCHMWPPLRIEDGKTQYFDGENLSTKDAQLDFELPISHKDYSGVANVIFKDVWPSPCETQVIIGFLGYSEDGFPIVNSNKGPVELQAKYIHIGYENARLVIDPVTREIIARYMAPHDNERFLSFSFESSGQAYLQTDGKCFKLPMKNRTKLSSANASKCGQEIDDRKRDRGTILADMEEKQMAYDILQDLDYPLLEYIDIRTYDHVSIIENSDLMVVNFLQPCT